MFKLCGARAVCRANSPSIVEVSNLRASSINHRLHTEHHAWPQPQASSSTTNMRHIWVLMHRPPHTMPNQFLYRRKSLGFRIALDSCTNITYAVLTTSLLNAKLHTVQCHIHQ